jgi:hypothetical protein
MRLHIAQTSRFGKILKRDTVIFFNVEDLTHLAHGCRIIHLYSFHDAYFDFFN